jgi:hypothetical protein
LADVQLPQEVESSLHWKVEPFSVAEKPKLAAIEVVVPEGPETIMVLGAVVSAGGGGACTVQPRVAADASALPAASVALTEKVCDPRARPLYALGEVQAPQELESSLHLKVEPLSLEPKARLARVEVVVLAGPELIVVLGAVVSAGGCGTTGGTTGGGGAGGPTGVLALLRGSEPASTSAPSLNPSPSVSNFRGLVLVRCSSTQLLSPSLSGSACRENVFGARARFVTVTVTA